MPATAAQRIPETREASRLFHSPEKLRLILCLMLAVITLLIYNPVSRHDFVNYDDDQYVFENAHVRAGLTWGTVAWAFTTNDAGNWHPVTWLSHALDFELFHLNPTGHHYTNVLLHVANAILLFLLLERVTGFTWRSLCVAALFALHPLSVESVAWIAERKNLLCTFFFLLGLAAYAWYARKPGIVRYLSVAVLFALGLMSKPMVITFPFVLLLFDFWPLGRLNFRAAKPVNANNSPTSARPLSALLLEKLPLLALSGASAFLTMWAQQAAGAVRSVADYSFPVRLQNAFLSYSLYLIKAVLANLARCNASVPIVPPPCPVLAALYRGRSATSLSFLCSDGLVLVSGDACAGDWDSPGGPSSYGRPLFLHPDHWCLHHAGMGNRR